MEETKITLKKINHILKNKLKFDEDKEFTLTLFLSVFFPSEYNNLIEKINQEKLESYMEGFKEGVKHGSK